MSDLIARAKKALEFKENDYIEYIYKRIDELYGDKKDSDAYRARHEIAGSYRDGGKDEFYRTAKLVEALLEIVETATLTDFEELRRCEKILERALDEMEKK